LNGGVGVILVVVVKATMGHRAARSNDDARSLCWSLLDQRLHDVLLFFFPSSLRSIVSSRCERSRYLPHLILLLVLDALLEAAKVHRQAQPSRRLSEEACRLCLASSSASASICSRRRSERLARPPLAFFVGRVSTY
jgi:hypothetical protein